MKRTARLRQLIERPEIARLPGVHDALSAKLAERAGFEALTMGGFAATGVLLGEPDSSQLGLIELADHYRRVCAAVELPLLADADTGFGNATNVRRAVREYESAGVAGLFIEDQVFPKRCGHTAGKAVIDLEEMLAKLCAALDARRDPDLVIMARTDAAAVHGLDAAIERAQYFREAGADLIFVEAPPDRAAMERVCRECPGPQLANMVDGGHSPDLTAAELEVLGFAAVVWPVAGVFAVSSALEKLYAALRRDGTTRAARGELAGFADFAELVGLPELRAREDRDRAAARRIIEASARPKNCH